MKNTIKIEVEIPIKCVANLLCSAFETSVIRYWARRDFDNDIRPERVKYELFEGDNILSDHSTEYPHIHWPLSGGAIVVQEYDDATDETIANHLLNMKQIESGLRVMYEKSPYQFGNLINELDDAFTADVFIQCCVLGEVKYG